MHARVHARLRPLPPSALCSESVLPRHIDDDLVRVQDRPDEPHNVALVGTVLYAWGDDYVEGGLLQVRAYAPHIQRVSNTPNPSFPLNAF